LKQGHKQTEERRGNREREERKQEVEAQPSGNEDFSQILSFDFSDYRIFPRSSRRHPS